MPLRPGCCSLSVLEKKEGVSGVLGNWQPKLLADGSHMAGGSTRDWGFEDIVIADGKVSSCSCIFRRQLRSLVGCQRLRSRWS